MKSSLNTVLILLLIIFTVSCTHVNMDFGNVSFSLDDVLTDIERSGTVGTDEYKIELKFTGGHNSVYSKVVKSNEIGTPKSIVNISDIPVNSIVNLAIKITDNKSTVIYEGARKSITINPGYNKIKINVDYPGWYVLWSIYDFSGNFDGSVKPSFNLLNKSLTGDVDYNGADKFLEDFCFDKNHNLYTVEKDVNGLIKGSPWTKTKVEVCAYSYEKNGQREVLYSNTKLSGPGSYNYSCITTDGEFLYLAKQTDGPNAGVDKISIAGPGHNPVEYITGISGNITSIEASGDYIYLGTTQDYQAECVVTRYTKNNPSETVQKTIPDGYFAITDMQVEGNKLYVLQRRTSGGEPNGVGGRLLPIDLSIFAGATEPNVSEGLGDGYNPTNDEPSEFSNAVSTPGNFQFCGPVKFVAIKPKKLIIADDGQYGTYNPDVADSVKNTNSVVTVDVSGSSPVVRSRVNVNNFNFDGAVVNGSSFQCK